MEPGSFQWCTVTGIRDNGHKLKHRKLQMNIRKHFFTVRVTKNWHTLPGEVVASVLGGIQKLSGHDPGQLALGGPA